MACDHKPVTKNFAIGRIKNQLRYYEVFNFYPSHNFDVTNLERFLKFRQNTRKKTVPVKPSN